MRHYPVPLPESMYDHGQVNSLEPKHSILLENGDSVAAQIVRFIEGLETGILKALPQTFQAR